MLSHSRRRIGVLSAVAVMAALLSPALTMSVASAIPATALSPVSVADGASYSACPTGSAAASGFTDTTSTDVDCIAMHGITTGHGDYLRADGQCSSLADGLVPDSDGYFGRRDAGFGSRSGLY